MVRHESDAWEERCKVVIAGAVIVPSVVRVWSYDGKWGGEAVMPRRLDLPESEAAALLIEMDGRHPVEIKSVSHRSRHETTVHFVGQGPPPFSPHAVPIAEHGRGGATPSAAQH